MARYVVRIAIAFDADSNEQADKVLEMAYDTLHDQMPGITWLEDSVETSFDTDRTAADVNRTAVWPDETVNAVMDRTF